MNIFKWIKLKIANLFKEEEFDDFILPSELEQTTVEADIHEVYFCLPEVKGNPYILIMDDFEGMAQLVKDELYRVQCCDAKDKFNILMSTGIYAAFAVEKYLKKPTKKIDVAILDITLGGIINGVEYDGIDIAIMLKEHNQNCVIKFLTGHALNKRNPEIFKFIEKFENFFNVPMTETKKVIFKQEETEMYKHIINKNGNRVAALGDLLETYIDLQKALKD